uniref:EKC/KEOPS complex subunit CGI121 n=1 Tax=Romanomermis culicivorax TaxID=13658 RepID=A0A915K0E0_ROMCU
MGRYSELFRLQVDPLDDNAPEIAVRICLFRNVKNAKDLKLLIQSGQVECSFVRAELILEIFQLLAATNKAIHCNIYGNLATKNIHSEIVYCLSPTRNITESLVTFGVHDDSHDILVVVVGDVKGDKLKQVGKFINGRPEPLSALRNLTDHALIKQIYNVKDPELNKSSIVDAVVSRIVSKDYVS